MAPLVHGSEIATPISVPALFASLAIFLTIVALCTWYLSSSSSKSKNISNPDALLEMGMCTSVTSRLRSAPLLMPDVSAPNPPPSMITALLDRVIKCVVAEVLSGNRCVILFMEKGNLFSQRICIEDYEPLQPMSVPHLKRLVTRDNKPYPLLFAKITTPPPWAADVVSSAAASRDLNCALFLDPKCRRSIASEMVGAGAGTTIKDNVLIVRRGPSAVDEVYATMYFPPRSKKSESHAAAAKAGRGTIAKTDKPALGRIVSDRPIR